jgi:hypothetical protein
MRRLTLVLIIGIAHAALSLNGVFAGPPSCTQGPFGSHVVCEGDFSNSGAGGDSGVQNVVISSGRSNTGTKYLPYNRLTNGPDGQPCVTTGYYAEGTSPNDAAATDPVTQNVRDIHGLPPLEYPPCPVQPRAPGEPAPLETPAMVAMRYWEQVPLPKPMPFIAPGRAITGKLAYLETRGEVEHTYTSSTIFGQLTIVASGSYVVDWGDGSTSGPHAFEGRAWPNGGITHDYLNVGTYDIVVTERWTARWALGGETGLLRTLQTTGRIDDFPVEQLQAVIGR